MNTSHSKTTPSFRRNQKFGITPSFISRLSAALAFAAALGSAHEAQAVNDLYWDTNGVTTDTGATTGIWGTNSFWNTDSTGGAGTFSLTTTSLNDLHFSAGTGATAGTVSLSGAALYANSITFEENVGVTLAGGNNTASIALGGSGVNSGISVLVGDNAANTVGAALLLNSANTFTNNGTGLLTINGPVGISAVGSLTINGTGATTISGLISGATATGTTALTIGGTATVTLSNVANTFTGDIAVNSAGAALVYSGTTVTTAAQFGRGPGTAYKQVFLTNGGAFRLSSADFNDNIPTTANFSAGVVFNVGTGGGAMDVALGRTLTIDDGFATGTGLAAAQLQGSGTLTKTGTGTLSLGNGTSNYSSFTGSIIVANGVLTTGAASTSPFGAATAGTTVLSGASIDTRGVSIGAEPLTLSGAGFGGRGALYASAAGGTQTGAIALAADTTFGALGAGGVGTLTISGIVSGTANVTKVGAGAVGFNAANTFTGTLNVSDGNLTSGTAGTGINVNGVGGRFVNVTGVTLAGGGVMNLGDATAANGLADRINTAASLTLGGSSGGGNLIVVRGSTVANSQSLTALNIGSGNSLINASAATGGVPILTFSGANPYTRSLGGVVNFTTTNLTTTFNSAPSGAGNIIGSTTPILVGGIVNSNDFAAAVAGNVGATTYTTDAWATGNNTQVLSSTSPATDSVTQALAFGTGANTVTLTGTNTVESGGILVQTAATSGTITGGNIQAASGKDLWVYLNAKPLTIASSIVDNGGSSLTVAGSAFATSILTLTGSNTYTGNTLVGYNSTLTLSNPAVNNTTIVGNIAIGGHHVANLNLGASDQIADASAITLNGGTISGQSAAFNLMGFNETIGSLATTVNPIGSASLIQNNSAAGASILTINGSGTTTYDGIIRNGAAGTLGIALAGTTNLTLSNTANIATTNYTGTTTIGAGTTLNMYDGNGGTIASFVSPITNNGTLSLNNVALPTVATVLAANRTTAAAISGGGVLNINAGISTITFSGALSFNGTTNLNSGSLVVSNAGAQTLSGLFTGAGGLSQTAAGALTLSNVGNNYTGPTSITAGALIFAGHSLPASTIVTIGAAGTLSILDNGAASNSTLAYGNTISPSSATSNVNVGANGGANTGNTVAFGTFNPTLAANSTTFTSSSGSYKISLTNVVMPNSTGQTTTLVPTTTSVSILGDVTNPMQNFASGNFDTLQLDGTSTGNSVLGNLSDAAGGSFANPLLGGYTRLIKSNTSTWTFSGTGSTYSGITQVTGGTLIAGANNVIPLTNLQGIQISNAAANATVVYDLGTNSQTLNTLGGTGTAISFAGAAATNAGTITGGAGSVLTINGGVTYTATNNPLGATISVATLNLGAGNRTFTINDSTTAPVDTTVTSIVQNGTLTKTGAGTLLLTQVPTANIALNAGTIDFNGNTITTFIANGGGTVQNGVLSGATFLKQGPGTLALAASASTTGVATLTINQGLVGVTANPATASQISANFANAGATNIFTNTATLTLGGSANNLGGGGALQLTGFAAGTNSQTFASTLIDAGANAAGGTIGAGGTLALNLGNVTRYVGGTIDYTIPAGAQSATNGIIVGGTPTAGNLVTSATGAAYATAGGNDWAANSTASANNIVAADVAGAASASIYTAASTAGTFSGNADITASFAATSDVTVNSLRFNTGALTLTLAGTNTITTGGLLIGNGTSGVTTITGGNIQPGTGVGEMAFIINKPNVQAIISSIIQDNGATPTTLTFRGNPNGGTTGGILGLTADNTYTGGTYVTSGRLQVVTGTATKPFGTGTVYVDGNADGQIFINTNTIIANPFVLIGNGFNEAGTRLGALRLSSSTGLTPQLSGAITLLGDTQITNSSAITGAGYSVISGNIGTSGSAGSTSFTLSKTGTGIIRLNGTNSQTNTLIAAGAISVGADPALGLSAAPITFNGGTLQYQSSFAIASNRPIVLTGAGTFDTGGLGTTSTTLANVISGAGALIKGYSTAATNSAPLILTGDNTFTGAVNVNNGWLIATSSTSLGLGAKTISVTNGSAGDVQLHLDPSLGNTPSAGIDLPANMPISISNALLPSSLAISNDSGNNIIRGAITNTAGGGGATIGSNAGTLTLTGTISANATGRSIAFRGNGAIVSTGVISDGSTFQLPVLHDTGTGTATLAGANTYAGLTTVSTGTLKLGNPNALGYGGITTTGAGTTTVQSNQGATVAAGATLDLGGTVGINEVITLNGTGIGAAGALINSNATTPAVLEGNMASATVATPGITANTVVTITGGGGTGAVAVASLGVTAASFAVTSNAQTYSAAPTVTIAGTGAAGATATAVLTNGFVTSVTITNAGYNFTAAPTLTFSLGTILAAGTPPTAVGNATNFQVDTISFTAPGTGYTSTPTLAAGTAVATAQRAAVVLGSDSTIGGVGDITIGGTVSGTAGLTKIGNGKLTLGGTNTFTNGVTLTGGTIIANAAAALGTGTTTVAPSTTLISGAGLTNAITLNGGTLGARAASTLTNTLTVSANSTVIVADPLNTTSENDIILTSSLLGSGNIAVQAGTSTLTPDGRPGFRLRGTSASTYSGTISVAAGAKFEEQATGAGPFSPMGTGKVIITGGTFTNDATPLDGTYPEFVPRNNSTGNTTFGTDVEIAGTGLVVINNPGTAPIGAITTLGNLKIGANQIVGPNRNVGNSQVIAFNTVTLTGGNATFAPNTLGVGFNGSVDLTLGTIGESAASGIIMDGQATLTLAAANSYTGSTTIQRGTTKLGAAGALPTTTALSVTGGTLDFNNGGTSNAQTVASLAGTGGIITNSDTNVRTFTVNQTSGSTAYSGTISGALALTKQGAGTLTLSGTHTYSGATTVNTNGGTLLINGSISGSATTVKSGGTLGGSGTLGTLTVEAGGIVSPGNSPGILTTGNLALAAASALNIEINAAGVAGTDFDRLVANGTVDITSATLSLRGSYTAAASDLFFVLLNDSTDAITGTFSGIAEGGTVLAPSGQQYQVFYAADFAGTTTTGGNDIALLAVVPEPASATLLLGGLALLAGARRRKQS